MVNIDFKQIMKTLSKLQSEAVKEFDKWFNHGTKSKPRFLLSSDFYNEVKQFLSDQIQKAVEETRKEITDALEIETTIMRDELKGTFPDRYSTDYKYGILRGYVLLGRELLSIQSKRK